MFLVEQANSVILKGSADFFSHMMNVLSVSVPAIFWIKKRTKQGTRVLQKQEKLKIKKMPDKIMILEISLR